MSENLQRIVTNGCGADLDCGRLSNGGPGDGLDRADAEPSTGARGSLDPHLPPVESAWPSPPGGHPRAQLQLGTMPPLINQLVSHSFWTISGHWINPESMEPAFEWPCSRLRPERNLSSRSCGLVLAAEDSKRHGSGGYERSFIHESLPSR